MRRWHVVVIIAACVIVSGAAWYLKGVDGLNVVGTISSIAGFAISIYVAVTIGDFRRRYVSHAVVADSLRRLELHRENLALGIRKKDSRKVQESLSGCKGLLAGLRHHLPSGFEIDAVISTAEQLGSSGIAETDPQLKECEHKLNALVERIRTHLMELQWGGLK